VLIDSVLIDSVLIDSVLIVWHPLLSR